VSRRWRRILPGSRRRGWGSDDGELVGPATPGATVLGVTGPPGAPGRTFIALNLAAVLSGRGATVLVDADPVLGTVGIQLDLDPERSLWFLAHEALLQPLDSGLLERHLQRRGALDILSGLDDAGEPGACTPELVAAVIASLRTSHQWVIVDIGALLSPFTSAVARCCDGLLWTVVANRVGSVAFDRTVRGRAAAAVAAGPWEGIVCNRYDRTTLAHAVADLEASYSLPVLGRIPTETSALRGAAAVHRPGISPGRMRRAFIALADRIGPRVVSPDAWSDVAWEGAVTPPPSGVAAPWS